MFAGLLWTFAILSALGIAINIVSAIFVIFAVCMAQDYPIFLEAGKRRSAVRRRAPVMLSAATTICAFGTFALAEHPGLKQPRNGGGRVYPRRYSSRPFSARTRIGRPKKMNSPKWTGRTRGGYLGNRIFMILLKVGLAPAYGLLAPVSFYYMTFRRRLCESARDYLEEFTTKKCRRSPHAFTRCYTLQACRL